MLIIYFVTLALSSGLVGLGASQILGSYGYVHGLHMSGVVAGGVGCAFASVQLLYMAVVRFLFPTRSHVPLFGETLSQLAALCLVPYLLHLPIPWPHPALQKVELFLFLGAFGATHGFFKLVSFYATIRGEPAGRLATLGWLLCSGACMGAAALLLMTWLQAAARELPQAPADMASYCVNGQCATARLAPEGAAITVEWVHRPGVALSLMLAYPPDVKPVSAAATDGEDAPPGRAYVTVEFDRKNRVTFSTNLASNAWNEVRIAADQIPEPATKAVVYWESRKEPAWQRWVNIRPTLPMNHRLLVAGPYVQQERPQATEPNFVVVVVEGLGADHVSALGYKRATTPALDRFSHSAVLFSNAYTPAPDISAACMTVLTGVNPLRHGFLGAHAGPLPTAIHTFAETLSSRGYATAAFAEGETADGKDLVAGGGFERGFQLFDPATSSADGDCGPTLEKVQAWIAAHAGVKYGLFVRLRELRRIRWHPRYAPGFAVDADNPTPLETYDSAVAYVDRQLGELIQSVRTSDAGKRTVILITSSCGPDFSAGPGVNPVSGLSEMALHVPLWMYGPDIKKTERPEPVGLEDIAPTVLGLAGAAATPLDTPLEGRLDGENLLPNPLNKSPISMYGDPLALSIRYERWRLTWQSGRSAFGTTAPGAGEVLGMYDALQSRSQGIAPDVTAKHPDLAARLCARLNEYFR